MLLIGGTCALAQSGSAPKYSEYDVKAAFLLNFMQFVEWPASATTNAEAPLLIGVLGEDPFGATLEGTIKGETIHGRPLTIKRKRQVAELKDCHLIFVCHSEKNQLKEITSALRGCSALTVSDIEQFCRYGGMIGLFNERGRIRFEINQEAAEQSNLKISSKLLRLGRLVAK
ncbi:MAG: YfiR family protein [Kiritimatiellaeota bacterium]|nr:YfiR family protein [Kiritimatiellota bacterium]